VADNERGFLSGWPPDVVYVVNGQPVTKSDILENKRRRQQRILADKRRVWDDTIVPCLIWTFYVPGPFYMGWWLYVRTLRRDWMIDHRRNEEFILKCMRLYPCGLLLMVENFRLWKAAFAEAYPRVTPKRATRQGMALARATVSCSGNLVDITGVNDPR
jgi:hypothetical protein